MIEHKPGEIYIDPEGKRHRCVADKYLIGCLRCSLDEHEDNPLHHTKCKHSVRCTFFSRSDGIAVHYERVEE